MLLVACGDDPAPTTDSPAIAARRILALGDSYTIGESVDPAGRWPVQLTAALRESGLNLDDPLIVARTGWKTRDLLAALDAAPPPGVFRLVTLMIGVNDQFMGTGVDAFAAGFDPLLTRAVEFAGGDPGRVIVVSIPDYSVTPVGGFGVSPDPAPAIDAFNALIRARAESAGVRFVDVTPLSREAGAQPEMLAPDGIHPSADMYAAWTGLILPAALDALQ